MVQELVRSYSRPKPVGFKLSDGFLRDCQENTATRFTTFPAAVSGLKHVAFTLLVTVVFLVPAAEAAQQVSGKATRVRDADTVIVGGVPVRLQGIDAPENGTRAGNEATAAMKRFLRGKELVCNLTGERTYDRWVGVCFTQEGHDIGAVMIANGLALDCRRYSGGRYRDLEPRGARSRLPQARYC